MKHLLTLFLLLAGMASAADGSRNLSVGAVAPPRVALVIGNAAYPGVGALRNPVHDATDMAAKLRTLGFEVMLRTDLRQKEMLRALTEFGERIQPGSEALFFYAGHGMQVRGRNFLIPVDADIRSESSVSSEAVDMDQLLDKLTPARLSMVILDACRNNPFERSIRGGGQGLAQINAPTGTLIAYATAPGKVAADGEGRNGRYTEELLAAIDIPGIKVEDVFKRVRAHVVRKSNDAQTPWESSSLTGDFYFRPGEAGASSAQAPAALDVAALDLAYWDRVKDSADVEDLRSYLGRFPNGQFVDLATRQIRKKESQDGRRLAGLWRSEAGDFSAQSEAAGARLTGSVRLTALDVSMTYVTWGDRFAPQDVAMEFLLSPDGGSVKGTWKRAAFKAGTCDIPGEEGTVEGTVAPGSLTLRFGTRRYRVFISRQMLWDDECKEIVVTGVQRHELVLTRPATGQ